MVKRIFSLSMLVALGACSTHLPPPSPSAVSGRYSQMADANRSAATLTLETAQPITLLQSGGPASDAELYCIASFAESEWTQNANASVQNGAGTVIPQYASLHVAPNEVKTDGDRVDRVDNSQAYATAYTDDGHQGAICAFELDKLRVVASN